MIPSYENEPPGQTGVSGPLDFPAITSEHAYPVVNIWLAVFLLGDEKSAFTMITESGGLFSQACWAPCPFPQAS